MFSGARIHARRTLGGDRHHRHLDRPVAAGRSGGPRAARRSQCTNNLKQLGLAMHMHHDTKQMFPPGETSGLTTGTAQGKPVVPHQCTWVAFTFPFIEQGALDAKIDWTLVNGDFYSNAGKNILTLMVPLFFCPSDTFPPPRTTGHVKEIMSPTTGSALRSNTGTAPATPSPRTWSVREGCSTSTVGSSSATSRTARARP